MSTKQLKLCEETALEIVKANHTVYARETPLSVAKEIQGLRAVFDEVLFFDPLACLAPPFLLGPSLLFL